MAKGLSEFEAVEGVPGISCARKGTLRCTAVSLKTGEICLFSPVQGLGDAARASLGGLGAVRFLFAPNHYHNKAIAEYAAAFPDAELVAPEAATPRLEKVTGHTFHGLGRLSATLPATMTLLHPEGLKTGEAWLRVEAEGSVTWVVVDAFCTTKGNAKVAVTETPELLGTFPKFGVADAGVYRRWVEERIAADKPDTVIPCHGAIIRSGELHASLRALIAKSF